LPFLNNDHIGLCPVHRERDPTLTQVGVVYFFQEFLKHPDSDNSIQVLSTAARPEQWDIQVIDTFLFCSGN